jgi:L-ectoine synthase
MIIRTLDEIAGTDRDVSGPGWRSRRIVLRKDGMEHSLHFTEVPAGTEMTLWYKVHLESNLVITGTGEVEDVATGEVHQLAPGSLYALDRHDRHIVRAHTDMQLVGVFTPALTGRETHDADGSYTLVADGD